MNHRLRAIVALTAVGGLLLAACSAPVATAQETYVAPGSIATPAESAAASSGTRLSSPAKVAIVQPTAGEQVTGSTVHVVLSLTGAEIVNATTTNVRPDQGHVHLYVDNVLVSMNYGLEQDLPVHPGTYVLKAEFVASDHAPFNPRVWSSEVYFTVK
jgi:hypothetical protein